MRIDPFGVEIWMNAHENDAELNLAETCVDSITVAELLALAGRNGDHLADLLPLRLGYGAIEGSDRLRDAIAGLHERQGRGNVIVAHGAAGANALVHAALVEPGDRVVSLVPTYQQHTAIPASFGADLRLVRLRPEAGFLPDLAELREACAGGAKLIAMVNPNNPTGSLMDRAMLEEVVAVARVAGAWLLCDEVYRGLDQEGEGTTASVADLYEKGISTGSMSKAFSLAGLRLGWVVGPEDLIEAVSRHRDYTTISVGGIDDHLAALALEAAPRILERSRRITRTNLALLDAWVQAEPLVSYVRPGSGTTALLRLHLDVPSEAFCLALQRDTGVMFTPGSALDMEGWVRVGFACATATLTEGLRRTSGFLAGLTEQGATAAREPQALAASASA